MGRRRKTAGGASVIILVVLGLVIWTISSIVQSVGTSSAISLSILCVVCAIGYKYSKYKARVGYLRSKYSNEEVVQNILRHRFWLGQTAEQLVESLGRPQDIDNKLLKTRKREVWKYNRRGVNRYGLRITLDDDVVCTWDQK